MITFPEWKSPCVDNRYFGCEVFDVGATLVDRPLFNEVLVVGDRCDEPCESDSDNNMDGDAGFVYEEEFNSGLDVCEVGAVEYAGFGIRKSE
jgi:hypothetical protein